MSSQKKVGLALGGGGARGLAHIGVIKELLRAGVSIDYIAGTSMGSIVGGWYAATKDIELLESIFLKLRYRDIFPIGEFFNAKKGAALFQGESAMKMLGPDFRNINIEECKIPFRAVATDMNNGDRVVLKTGKLADAVRASSSIPVLFPPVKIGEMLLADGGFSDPVPVDVVKEMGADVVIAVDVSSKWTNPSGDGSADIRNVYSMFSSALSIVSYQLTKEALANADVVLHPPISRFDWLEFGKGGEIMKVGAEEARLHLKKIREKLDMAQPKRTIGEKFMDFITSDE